MKKKITRIGLIALTCLTLMPVTTFAGSDTTSTVTKNKIKTGALKETKKLLSSPFPVHVKDKNDFEASALPDTKSFVRDILGGTKFFAEAKQWYDTAPENSLFKAKIHLSFDVSEEAFEKKFKEMFGESLNFEKEGLRSYNVTINKEQAEKLQSMDEILFLSSANEKKVEIIDDPPQVGIVSSAPISTFGLYDGVEFSGARKARTDFNVTGDFDGNEESYSKNDIVIAVVDSGISGHAEVPRSKIIGWYDAVDYSNTPSDNIGHGTKVASVVAGKTVGYAPGAALVGVKVTDNTGYAELSNLVEGLTWVYDHLSEFKIDAINISLAANDDIPGITEVKYAIKRLNDAGYPVFIAAGNAGDGSVTVNGHRFYNTINRFAIDSPFIIGNVKDPSTGGWGLNVQSSKGTGATGPFITAPGTNVGVADIYTGGLTTSSGTSFSSPAMAGIFALMKDAALTSRSNQYAYFYYDYGPTGYDKIFGNGIIAAYDSIKYSANVADGFYSDGRDYIVAEDHGLAGYYTVYPLEVYDGTIPFNINLYILNENGENIDLVVWNPGHDPHNGDAPDLISASSDTAMPQESISISNPTVGKYWIGARTYNDADFHIDLVGKIHP